MTYKEYQAHYLNDFSDKYHHLPQFDTAKSIAKVLHQRFIVNDLTEVLQHSIADKFDVTDAGVKRIINLLTRDGEFQELKL
ncbi:hypothetical protein [Leuconostoc sp. LN180020]|uniref:hypothetical protein n=1 Tax=Leuconostoc sp. LN180020 TaxID=2571156 RepID=UPI00177FE974|nr:hypothetical protein [Leuconostoc sp. LN180020]QOG10688.1 hypothetical protein FAZ25_07490 [Leuconostoc sp. LN180020]